MSPTCAEGPTLSRTWVSVCVICPALQAVSATGEKSSTPRAAARSARFTAVDLQQGRAGYQRDRWHDRPSLSVLLARPPGGKGSRCRGHTRLICPDRVSFLQLPPDTADNEMNTFIGGG